MSDREHTEPRAGPDSSPARESPEPLAGFIRSAVLGLAFGAVLFMVSDLTGLAKPLLHWLSLPGMESHLGPKQLVIVGILLGVSVNVLDHLFRRTRRLLGDFVA